MRVWMWIALLIVACGRQKPVEVTAVQLATDGGIDFAVQDLNGGPVQLSQYRGKVVLLNIWATWCGPCKKEIPDLNEIHAEYGSQDVVVLGVLLESGTREEVKAALDKDFTLHYPQWLGDEKLSRQFEISGFPTTIIIDKEGKIRERLIGQHTKKQFIAALQSAGV